jgi:hypothetical protein
MPHTAAMCFVTWQQCSDKIILEMIPQKTVVKQAEVPAPCPSIVAFLGSVTVCSKENFTHLK